jgi:iron complex transport system substrate-binding protein
MKKSLVSLILAGIMAISFTACSNNGGSSESSTSSSASSQIEDRLGSKVDVPDSIKTIISTSPANTEILVGLGLKDKIIAADTYSADTGIDASKATLDIQNLNLEQIISLKPDAVFVDEINTDGASDPYSSLKDAGIKVFYIPSANSLQSIKDNIKFIAGYTQTDEKGAELIKNIDDTIDKIKKTTEKAAQKKKIYFEISQGYSFGKDTFLNEIIELAGGENIFAGQSGWIAVTDESIISANPDVIITNVSYDGYDYKEILSRPGWDAINAVKNKNVIQVPLNPTSRASQNIVEGMTAVAKAINPDLYE